jgi:hypothetical protein
MVEMVTKLPIKTEGGAARKAAYEMERPWYPMDTLRRSIDRLFGDFDMGFWPTQYRRPLFDYEPYAGTRPFSTLVVDVAETAARSKPSSPVSTRRTSR